MSCYEILKVILFTHSIHRSRARLKGMSCRLVVCREHANSYIRDGQKRRSEPILALGAFAMILISIVKLYRLWSFSMVFYVLCGSTRLSTIFGGSIDFRFGHPCSREKVTPRGHRRQTRMSTLMPLTDGSVLAPARIMFAQIQSLYIKEEGIADPILLAAESFAKVVRYCCLKSSSWPIGIEEREI